MQKRLNKMGGRRVPLQLQTAVEAEIKKLLKDGHKDKTVKIALDARSLNNAIQKEKYQMPKLDNLMEQVAEVINTDKD